MSWEFQQVDLTLNSAVLVGGLRIDPNGAATHSFIPGSVIRGAIASRLSGAAESDFRDLILSGQVRYLNAYPRIGRNRSMPLPLSLRTPKGDDSGKDVFDLAAHDPRDQFVSPGAGFALPTETGWKCRNVTKTRKIHNARHRPAGKAWTRISKGPGEQDVEQELGTIFFYESLQAEQTFTALFQVASDKSALFHSVVGPHLAAQLMLGRSRVGGYGLTSCVLRNTSDHEYDAIATLSGLSPGAYFRVLLTSDCIIRDPETGQINPASLAHEIEKALHATVDQEHSFISHVVRGGYNRKWGLTLPQTLCVQAGSVYVLTASKSFTDAELREMEDNGFGERLTEGFGRFVLLPPPEPKISLSRDANVQLGPWPDSGAAPILVRTIEARIFERALRQRIAERAEELAAQARYIPPASLLNRLRIQVHRTASNGATDGLQTLRSWLHRRDPRLRRTALDKLAGCKLTGGGTFLSWMQDILGLSDESHSRYTAEEELQLSQLSTAFDFTGRAALIGSAKAAAAGAFLDATLAALAKRKASE